MSYFKLWLPDLGPTYDYNILIFNLLCKFLYKKGEFFHQNSGNFPYIGGNFTKRSNNEVIFCD